MSKHRGNGRRVLQLLDGVPIGRVCQFVHVELLKKINQPFCAQRRSHFMKGFTVTFGVLHAEVLVVESGAPKLDSECLGLVEVHQVQSLYKYWMPVQ